MIKARLLFAAIGFVLVCGPTHAQAPAPSPAPKAAPGHITLAKVQALFADLKVRGLDTNGELPWCFYFLGYDRSKLDAAAKMLTAEGYAVVNLESQPNALPDGPRVWQLEVRRREHLTPEGLLARDEGFYSLADKVGSIYYDGLDVDTGP